MGSATRYGTLRFAACRTALWRMPGVQLRVQWDVRRCRCFPNVRGTGARGLLLLGLLHTGGEPLSASPGHAPAAAATATLGSSATSEPGATASTSSPTRATPAAHGLRQLRRGLADVRPVSEEHLCERMPLQRLERFVHQRMRFGWLQLGPITWRALRVGHRELFRI